MHRGDTEREINVSPLQESKVEFFTRRFSQFKMMIKDPIYLTD